MTHYILINAKTRTPVPLPWEAVEANGDPVTVYDCTEPQGDGSISAQGILHTSTGMRLPEAFGLALITEEQFMAERT